MPAREADFRAVGKRLIPIFAACLAGLVTGATGPCAREPFMISDP